MPAEKQKLPVIQVCGDPTVDWLSVRAADSADKGGIYFWSSDVSVPAAGPGSQAGGSALLLEFIKSVADGLADVQGAALEKRLLRKPLSGVITNSWTTWKAYQDKGAGKPAFRLGEWQGCEHGRWAYEDNRLTGKADLLVIEDSGIAFRDIEAGWPDALIDEASRPECILLKLAKYGGDMRSTELKRAEAGGRGRAWNPLMKKICDEGLGSRTTVVTALSDLRSCAVKIGASLSWDMLLEETVHAVYSPECPFAEDGKLLFARVVVTIGTGGAVVVEPGCEALVFDRGGQEDDFSGRHAGEMMGLNTCVVGALAAHWAAKRGDADWCEAARVGLGLARFLDTDGYGVVPVDQGGARRSRLQFPSAKLSAEYQKVCADARAMRGPVWNLGLFRTRDCTRGNPVKGWSILEETVKARNGRRESISNALNAVTDCARDIALIGPEAALPDIPLEAVGKWRSADRQEIEGVRSVNNAIRRYLGGKNSAPLCIAVFGPPGAGKSFAVKEVARQLGIEKESQLTFNLSQFTSTEELAGAFHQIRDLNLKGSKPLVFFDEFDTPFDDKPLGWLKYFLAPMQDGEFTDRGRVHPIGGGIFVFAGATRPSFAEFCRGASPEELSAKKPDFISRLKAYIDVKGPNGMPNTIEDKLYVIRRAFLLNFFLETHAQDAKTRGRFQVERGVLDAFLRVTKYRHGARSMETIVSMSNLKGKSRYELSSLPPTHTLDMHVNAKEFMSLTSCGHRETMRVGITGHIGLEKKKELPEITKAVERAIQFVEGKFPERSLAVFSPLSLGADRLVARMLLEREGAGLIAVPPLPRDDYANDFGGTDDHNLRFTRIADDGGRLETYGNAYEDAEMRQEFNYWMDNRAVEVIEMPQAPTRDIAYRNMGYFIAENSDILFAVWDGQAAQGTGGTGDIVQRALDLKKPVVHVWAGNYKSNPQKRTAAPEGKLGKFRYINLDEGNGEWAEI